MSNILRKRKQKGVSDIIPIVFATNDNYAPYVSSCIESIRQNSSRNFDYRIFVFHVGLTDETVERLDSISAPNITVKCINVQENINSIQDRLYSHSYFSQEMYYRILIPEILTEYEKVIYLDCDMIALGDLSELYQIPLEGYCLAACRNLMHAKMQLYVSENLGLQPEKYINSGMLVINCKEFIRCDIKNKILDEITLHEELRYPDQDLINLICKDRIYYLPLNWNYLWHMERLNLSANEELKLLPKDRVDFEAAGTDVKIMHYTGDKKPWHYNAIPGAEIFWRYADCCNFSDIIRERFLSKNTHLQGIRLLFLDFARQNIELTCSYDTLNPDHTDRCSYILDSDIKKATFYHEMKVKSQDCFVYQKLFKIKISIKSIKSVKHVLGFAINGQGVIPQYHKFFPLNGCNSSYFAHRGVLMYREFRSIVFECCTVKKRIKRERVYLKQLRKSEDGIQKKAVFVRLLYFFSKHFVPKNVWLISDRPGVAGDNGEALFRYLNETKKYKKKIKPYFVIDRSSPDYKRLKKIGKVLALSSFKHKMYSLHCAGKAVSQTDGPLYEPVFKNYIKDLLYVKRHVFLQHGITKDDISRLYSRFTHNFDLFVTASYPEYNSIVQNADYGCPAGITRLTGFPRHDRLDDCSEKTIVITPTWRKELFFADHSNLEHFKGSEYFRVWHSLLTNSRLLSLAKERGYRIWFVPHNMMEDFLGAFDDVDPCVEILKGNKNYAEIFSKGSVLISDYSSNTFEFSYLRKPVVYYQYDADTFFASHTYNKGYFEYERDGFGKVVKDEEDLVTTIANYLENDCRIEDEYRERIDAFFKYNDKENSERVVRAMLKLYK